AADKVFCLAELEVRKLKVFDVRIDGGGGVGTSVASGEDERPQREKHHQRSDDHGAARSGVVDLLRLRLEVGSVVGHRQIVAWKSVLSTQYSVAGKDDVKKRRQT